MSSWRQRVQVKHRRISAPISFQPVGPEFVTELEREKRPSGAFYKLEKGLSIADSSPGV